MFWILVLDAPFSSEVKLSDYTTNTCYQNTETDIKKVGNTVIAAWIKASGSPDDGNWLVMSFDGGNTWSGAVYLPSNDPSCWIGDPAIAIQPDNPNTLYFAGMIYCQSGSNVKGEVYFCRCTSGSGCTDANNWTCGLVGPNDNWGYFKDKPWLLALGNNTVLVNFTTDKFAAIGNLVIYKSTDNGGNWTEIGRTNWPSTVGYWAKDGNNIYMSYNDFSQWPNIGVGFLRSQDNGNTFSDVAKTYFNSGGDTYCQNYQRAAKIHDNITASNGKVAISLVDGNCKVNVGVWTGSGNSLTTYQVAPSSGGLQQVLPMLASSGNTIYAQWQGRVSNYGNCGNMTLGTWATYWASSSNWGQTWSSAKRVSSTDHAFSENPFGHDYNGWIIDGNTIYTTWANDYRDDNTGDTYFSYAPISKLQENFDEANVIYISYQKDKVIIQSSEPFKVYNVDGKLVSEYKEGKYELNLRKGVYFIKSSKDVEKLVIR